ncbi:MAG: hypothetical protein J6Z80_04900 [Clostridia bacterium]|nr:hypothetical protein [Clostridia bacterium]
MKKILSIVISILAVIMLFSGCLKKSTPKSDLIDSAISVEINISPPGESLIPKPGISEETYKKSGISIPEAIVWLVNCDGTYIGYSEGNAMIIGETNFCGYLFVTSVNHTFYKYDSTSGILKRYHSKPRNLSGEIPVVTDFITEEQSKELYKAFVSVKLKEQNVK